MNHQGGRVRIAPVNQALISSARSRDPRLSKMREQPQNVNTQQLASHASLPAALMSGSSMTKSLPRIPKFSHANNNKVSRDKDERDPRNRRNKEKEESKLSKSPTKSKSSSHKSPSRSNDRKKSGSSDDSSPRKKSEDEKKSSKTSSSGHRSSHSRSRSSKSPAKVTESHSMDVDLRVESSMIPDSTTNINSREKILSNGDGSKSTHEMITSNENGKETKLISVTMTCVIVTMM
jgi:hypothetical protein